MSQPSAVTIVGRKVEGKWEVALISNGRFLRSFTGNDLTKIVSPLLMDSLKNSHPEDTEINITVNTVLPVVKSDEPTDS